MSCALVVGSGSVVICAGSTGLRERPEPCPPQHGDKIREIFVWPREFKARRDGHFGNWSTRLKINPGSLNSRVIPARPRDAMHHIEWK